MINRIFFEGRCLVERRGSMIYNDDPKGKLPICVATFLNKTKWSKIYKTFLFLGDLAVYAKQNFAINKFYVLEASFKKVRGVTFLTDKEDPNCYTYVKGENLVVYKIYRSYRTYAKEETTELEKNLKHTSTHIYQTSDWELLARKKPVEILTKDKIKDYLRGLGIYELEN